MSKRNNKINEIVFVSYPLNEDKGMQSIAKKHGLLIQKLENPLIKHLLKVSNIPFKKNASYIVARNGSDICIREKTEKKTSIITLVVPV